jgi:hypothetical protein
MAGLIAWMLVVRIDDLVKDGAKRRRLRRSSILDKTTNTNRNAVQAIKAAFSASQINPRHALERLAWRSSAAPFGSMLLPC